jgi:hypothetical protein
MERRNEDEDYGLAKIHSYLNLFLAPTKDLQGVSELSGFVRKDLFLWAIET